MLRCAIAIGMTSVVCATALVRASETQAAALPVAAAAAKKAPVSTPAASPAPAVTTSTGETLEEIVARVRRRLATDVARPVRRVPVARPPDRVTLVWRPAVVWPLDLAAPGPDVSGSGANRVTLVWDPSPR